MIKLMQVVWDLGYGLEDQQLESKRANFSLLRNVQISFGAQPGPFSKTTGVLTSR
jgi:hypothetical protein